MSTAGAETRIGKGDRVRIVSGKYYVGRAGEVVDINCHLRLVRFDDGPPGTMPFWVSEDDLAPSPEAPRFIVGQRVRVTSTFGRKQDAPGTIEGPVPDSERLPGAPWWSVRFDDGDDECFPERCLEPEVEPRPTHVIPGHVVLTDDAGTPAYFRRRSILAWGTIREGAPGAGLSWIVTDGGFVVVVRESAAEIAAMLDDPEGR
jgi:hypothetical protein